MTRPVPGLHPGLFEDRLPCRERGERHRRRVHVVERARLGGELRGRHRDVFGIDDPNRTNQ